MNILYLIVYDFTRFRCAENCTPQDHFRCVIMPVGSGAAWRRSPHEKSAGREREKGREGKKEREKRGEGEKREEKKERDESKRER